MSNPFKDGRDGKYPVVNRAGRHSRWPALDATRPGRAVAVSAAGRAACLDRVTAERTGVRAAGRVTRDGGRRAGESR